MNSRRGSRGAFRSTAVTTSPVSSPGGVVFQPSRQNDPTQRDARSVSASTGARVRRDQQQRHCAEVRSSHLLLTA